MKLNPKYSYEYNQILNPTFNEMEQIKNFASLLSDKDRFLPLLPELETHKSYLEETLGYVLPETLDIFIVRAEQFKSFSEPITVEYSILPEEMILYTLKELLKITITTRFPDEKVREEFINAYIDFFVVENPFSLDLVKQTKSLHEESQKNYPSYEFREMTFSKDATLKQQLEKYYDENPIQYN